MLSPKHLTGKQVKQEKRFITTDMEKKKKKTIIICFGIAR